ncbi:MAG: ABC transporter ATP-binding protein [Bacteroidetes bacterium]|nr:ABC transporter ATP-binding protein [Bacteroidota bacterium]
MITELHNINKDYINNVSGVKHEVLKGISFTLNNGEAMSIVGPSGSGKSTLLNIIGTMDKPTSGAVKLYGNEISDYNETQLAEIRNQKIGFIFQSHHLLPQLNVLENILLPTIPIKDKLYKKLAVERAKKLLIRVGLVDNIHQLPGELSGGECQRVAVVRALINEPDLILADEPTGSLDEESAASIGKLLFEMHKENNTALIVVTHSLKLANTIGNIHKLTGGMLISA